MPERVCVFCSHAETSDLIRVQVSTTGEYAYRCRDREACVTRLREQVKDMLTEEERPPDVA